MGLVRLSICTEWNADMPLKINMNSIEYILTRVDIRRAIATRESIPPEHTVQYKMFDNRLWNISEWQHIVLGPAGILDRANESFDDWFMIISSSQVKIYVHETLELIEFFIRPDLLH
jgi:hypothetical protein